MRRDMQDGALWRQRAESGLCRRGSPQLVESIVRRARYALIEIFDESRFAVGATQKIPTAIRRLSSVIFSLLPWARRNGRCHGRWGERGFRGFFIIDAPHQQKFLRKFLATRFAHK